MTIENNTAPYVVATITVPQTMIFLRPVLLEMQRRGWRIMVVVGTTDDDLPTLPEGVPLSRIPMSRALTPLRDAVSLGRMTRMLRHEKPDAVIGSTPKAAMVGVIGARLARVPTRIFLVRGARWDGVLGPAGTLMRLADRVTAASASRVVAVSRSLAELMVASGVLRTTPAVIGRGGSKGVDIERFRPALRSGAAPRRICFIGRLASDKGVDDVLEVFARCRAELPDLELVIAGNIDDAQPISPETRRALTQPGVSWPGPVEDVPKLLQSVDLLVFPSVREGLPNVVIEAAACAVPTVAYRVTGVVDAVEDGTTGRLVPPGDVEALTRATLELLTSGELEHMGLAARQFAVDNFAQENVVKGFVDFVESEMSLSTQSPER